MAEPGVSEIATTTLRKRHKKIYDNVMNNNPILYYMDKLGNVEMNVSGRTILAEHDYAENATFKRYSGNETLNTTQDTVLTSFEYNWKQAAVAVILNGLEEVQNSGTEAVISLLKSRIDNAERTIKNRIESDLRSDGTADGSKQIGGLDLLLAEDPTTGTVGAINRATSSYARNYKFGTTTDGSGVASASNIESYMRKVGINTTRMGDNDKLWLLGNTYWEFLSEAMSSRQRFVDTELANLGFDNFKFDGTTCILGGGYQFAGTSASAMTATKAYHLNLGYMYLKVGKGRFFKPLSERDSTNQDAMIKFLVFCGNLCCSNFGLQGVLFDG